MESYLQEPSAIMHVYVCLHCGRRSIDRHGVLALSDGWNPRCAKRALRIPAAALKVDDNGLVASVSKKAVLVALRAEIN
jgi:hypothetical protein